MWNKTSLAKKLGIEYPIIQAPMAGGPTTPELIAAVSNAGGLGSLGAGYLSPEAMRESIKQIRALTQKPFSVNVFVPETYSTTPEKMREACDAVNQCTSPLNITAMPVEPPYLPSFEEQVAVLLEENVPVFSFTFGVPGKNIIDQFKSNNTYLIGTATTLDEARMLQDNGIDAIVAQGAEAGGHRGTFLTNAEYALIPLAHLLPELVKHVDLPVIASGGIMNGASIVKVMQLGASAVQLGSAFLCCQESGIDDAYKKCLLNQTKDTTALTRVFSGKLARGVSNTFMRSMAEKVDSILDYPIQNKLTTQVRQAAKLQGNAEYMSLWAGQFVYMAEALDASTLMSKLIDEANAMYKDK